MLNQTINHNFRGNDYPVPCLPFGVELEVENVAENYDAQISNRENLNRAIREDITMPAGNNNTEGNTWKAIRDASLSRGGLEFVSPVLKGKNGVEQVVQATRVINSLDAQIRERCGYHVHISVPDWAKEGRGRDAFAETLCRVLRRIKPQIQKILAPSRRSGNRYCRPQFETGSNYGGILHQKFLWVTAHAIRQGHIEFRCHQGTTDPRKILSWAAFACAIVKRVSDMVESTITNEVANDNESDSRYVSDDKIKNMSARVRKAIETAKKKNGRLDISDLGQAIGRWGSDNLFLGNRLLRAIQERGVVIVRPRQGYYQIDFANSDPRALTLRQRSFYEAIKSRTVETRGENPAMSHSHRVQDIREVIMNLPGMLPQSPTQAFYRLARSLRSAGVDVRMNTREGNMFLENIKSEQEQNEVGQNVETTYSPANPGRNEFSLTAANYGAILGAYFDERRQTFATA